MEKQNESVRDRLLTRMPQPENLAVYREETTSLLAKHEKALFWERMGPWVCYVIAFAAFIVSWFWGQNLGGAKNQFLWFWAGFAYFVGAVTDLRYRIYKSKVDLLKEVKQVQLQVLELQASLGKSGAPKS